MRIFKLAVIPVLVWIVYAAQADIYTNENRIFNVIPDHQWYYHEISTGVARDTLHIPDIEENRLRTLDMIKVRSLRDVDDAQKYSIKEGAVVEKPKWKPKLTFPLDVLQPR